ncbi:MAG TPA: hypothetical protein P5142_15470 [Spirochaetia bacterium]|nr:hypothetical protein [Spirochaetia bacterium]
MGRSKDRGTRTPAMASASLLAAALLASALASSCSYSDQFADYRDEGINFIAARDFSPANIDLTDIGFETPALWTWAWRGSVDSTYDYMTFTDQGTVGASAVSGLASTAEYYRLELDDLVTNGNFEAFADEAALLASGDWTESDAARMEIGPTSIHDNSINLSFGSSAQWVAFDLSSLNGLVAGNDYPFTLIMNSASVLSVGYQVAAAFPGGTPNTLDRITAQLQSGDTEKIYFYSNNVGTAVLDDLRAYRYDLVDVSNLRLRLRPSDTSPILADGFYEFTLWVRKPADARFSSETGALANLASRYVTLRMSNLREGQGVAGGRFSVNGDGQWHQIVLRQDLNFEGIAEGTETAIELAIFPFDAQSSDPGPEPGAVEIAQPELHFYLDGY